MSDAIEGILNTLLDQSEDIVGLKKETEHLRQLLIEVRESIQDLQGRMGRSETLMAAVQETLRQDQETEWARAEVWTELRDALREQNGRLRDAELGLAASTMWIKIIGGVAAVATAISVVLRLVP